MTPMPFHRSTLQWIFRNACAIAMTLGCVAGSAGAHGPVPPSLLGVAPPASPGLLDGPAPLVVDRDRAIQLGKALFWDADVGADGVACASCHFHAGADARVRGQLAPGLLHAGAPTATTFEATGSGAAGGPDHRLVLADFPFRKRLDPFESTSPVVFSTDDVASSAGVHAGRWLDDLPRSPTRDRCRAVAHPIFQRDGFPRRQVEPRNSPSVINAVFNHRNFWDGRANNVFNGRSVWGNRDPDAAIFVRQPNGAVVAERLALRNASLASQAVAPPLSDVEMSCEGRGFEDIGRALLPRRPLERQAVHPEDGVLDELRHPSGVGLATTYRELVEAAFPARLWAGSGDFGAPATGGPPWSHAEANFALFFGLAIQLYEATLISDQSPFDLSPRDAQDIPTALSSEARAGLEIFRRDHCGDCHAGAALTFAATDTLPLYVGGVGSRSNVTRSTTTTGASLFDRGFVNTGGVETANDPGLGTNDPFGRRLWLAIQYRDRLAGAATPTLDPVQAQACDFELPFTLGRAFTAAEVTADPAGHAGCEFPNRSYVPTQAVSQAEASLPGGGRLRVAVNGAFKIPSLRNVELTGPYMHDGGMATLEQVVQFYARGGNAAANPDLHSFVFPLGQTPQEAAQLVAFLKTLTDGRVRWELAPFDHPELRVPHGRNADGSEAFLVVPAVGRNGRTPEQGPLQPFHVSLGAP